MSENTTLWIIVLVGVTAALVFIGVTSRQSRTRRATLRQRFGPEYERALQLYGSPMRAHHALEARAKRVTRFHLRELDDSTRARFATAWASIQSRFVDDPSQAVREAHRLIKEVMVAVGYPAADDFEQRTEDLSVDHPNVVRHYRAAHALAEIHQNGQIDTEVLRQAVVHYRALFAELVERRVMPTERTLRQQHA